MLVVLQENTADRTIGSVTHDAVWMDTSKDRGLLEALLDCGKSAISHSGDHTQPAWHPHSEYPTVAVRSRRISPCTCRLVGWAPRDHFDLRGISWNAVIPDVAAEHMDLFRPEGALVEVGVQPILVHALERLLEMSEMSIAEVSTIHSLALCGRYILKVCLRELAQGAERAPTRRLNVAGAFDSPCGKPLQSTPLSVLNEGCKSDVNFQHQHLVVAVYQIQETEPPGARHAVEDHIFYRNQRLSRYRGRVQLTCPTHARCANPLPCASPRCPCDHKQHAGTRRSTLSDRQHFMGTGKLCNGA